MGPMGAPWGPLGPPWGPLGPQGPLGATWGSQAPHSGESFLAGISSNFVFFMFFCPKLGLLPNVWSRILILGEYLVQNLDFLGPWGPGPWAPEAAGRQPTFLEPGGVRGGGAPPAKSVIPPSVLPSFSTPLITHIDKVRPGPKGPKAL